MKLTNKIANWLAAGLLILMLLLAFFSMRGDSAIMDELAHIPAGYSYIVKQDMRLNPEHPPLLKDLAGLSVWLGSKLTATPIHFPDQVKSWQEDINGQWNFGGDFLYRSGNDADKIIFWARLPMLLIMLLLGFYVFKWAREIYGNKAGLLALFLYSFCPTFLAHSRFVTTDVGAAAAFFIATYYLIKWLRQPTAKNLVVAGIVFGLAMLTKFSLNLLVPYFIFLVVVWCLINYKVLGNVPSRLLKGLFSLLLIGLIGMVLVFPIYLFHTWHYPPDRQYLDTEFILRSFSVRWLADSVIWLSDKPFLRAYGQFFLGLLMVLQRAVGGNTTYFLGEVSAAGWWYYFPMVFLIKVPLVFLILIVLTLLIVILSRRRRILRSFGLRPQDDDNYCQRFCQWLKNYFTEFALISFLALYWITTLRSNLNIGVRHILPTFPVLYVLIGGKISQWLALPFQSVLEKIKETGIVKGTGAGIWLILKTSFKYLLIIILLGWYVFGTIKIYPHFLAYFNELAGGPSQGYRYVTDSNLDWGQDLKRLAKFVQKNNIQKIYLNYFGGASAQYYLGDKFQDWRGDRNPQDLPADSWLAVSATLLQGGRGKPAASYQAKTGYYNWLNQYQPVEIIGYSIFVYRIE